VAGGIVPVTVAAVVGFALSHVVQSFVADAVADVVAGEEAVMDSIDIPKEEIAMACELNSSICSCASGFEASAHMFTTSAKASSTSVYSSIPPLKYAWLITQV
jgi:large-conductance mechanosensitive channel